jgi:hypothetical protein
MPGAGGSATAGWSAPLAIGERGGDGWHDLRPDPDAAEGVVHQVLAVRHAGGRRLGAEPAAVAGDRLLPTAWAMLRRLRSVLVRVGRYRLAGVVEVDETFIGGDEPGLRGGQARGKKVLTGIAVEVREPKGIGRCYNGQWNAKNAATMSA